MTIEKGICPVCGSAIAPHRRFCQYHWSFVNPALQKTITALYNNGKPREGYLEACASAIAQVRGSEPCSPSTT